MQKIRLTKTELRLQKDALARYKRYLPTLTLKKQQLQVELLRIRENMASLQSAIKKLYEQIKPYYPIFANLNKFQASQLLSVLKYEQNEHSIAGVKFISLDKITFEVQPYSILESPFWFDEALNFLQARLRLNLQLTFLQKQHDAIEEEFESVSQKVNLFEYVRIPQTENNIKRIVIYLSDESTAAVVRGKIAKKKRQRRPDDSST